ncbi:hypothetical protein ACJJTC_010174 [Scirpophaga incertulas]
MLSGVGPKNHLTSKNIRVIKDLPVGKTLYDHITFPTLVFTLNTTRVSFNEARVMGIRYIFDWLRDGDNDLSSPGGVEGIGYIKTPVSDDPEPVPDIELISIVILGMYGNYLTDPKDVATFIAAIRHIQELVATEPFQKFGTKLHNAQYPKCKRLKFNSDEYWECAIRTVTATLHHQIATCRMGPASDHRAIVDPELRVYGIKNLRVIDSSVIPRTISAHTHAPAVMIGEKGADMIKRTWNMR